MLLISTEDTFWFGLLVFFLLFFFSIRTFFWSLFLCLLLRSGLPIVLFIIVIIFCRTCLTINTFKCSVKKNRYTYQMSHHHPVGERRHCLVLQLFLQDSHEKNGLNWFFSWKTNSKLSHSFNICFKMSSRYYSLKSKVSIWSNSSNLRCYTHS